MTSDDEICSDDAPKSTTQPDPTLLGGRAGGVCALGSLKFVRFTSSYMRKNDTFLKFKRTASDHEKFESRKTVFSCFIRFCRVDGNVFFSCYSNIESVSELIEF
jgi:hypothetical protein